MADPKATGALPIDPSNPSSFPPPPPGPPPTQGIHGHLPTQFPAHSAYPQHTNEQPIPDYNPADPQFAAPPAEPYDDTPSDDEKRGARGKAWSQKLHQLGAKAAGPINSLASKMGAQSFLPTTMDKECEKAAGPINSLASKMGAQSFLPTTMDKECEKAAKIIKSFCKEGIEADNDHVPVPVTPIDPASSKDTEAAQKKKAKAPGKAIVKIPQKVLVKAVGLAIFTTARVGFQISGATGSGILIARLPDGTWSPPSGIQVHALGAGFSAGIDIYDCVCVINTKEALSAFMDTRVSLGPEVAVAAGPYGAGGGVDFGTTNRPESRREAENKEPHTTQLPTDATHPTATTVPVQDGADKTKLKPDGKPGHHRRSSSSAFKPVFSYVKSRGLYAGIQVDGTVVTERKEANAAFYGEKVSVAKILTGDVPIQSDPHLFPAGAKVLLEALKHAEAPRAAEVLVTPAPVVAPTSAPAPVTAPAPGIDPSSPSVPLAGPIYVPHSDTKQAQAIPSDDPPPYVEDQKTPVGLSDQKTMYD